MSEDKRYCGKLTEEWLQDYPARTRTRYRNRFKKALKWLGMTDAEIVAEYKRATDKEAWRRKWGHKVKQYYTYLVEEKGMAVNTARADISGLRAFLTFHCMTVKIKKGAIPKPQRATNEHIFKLTELQRMYAVGDAREQAILSTAVCLGWGYGDFSKLQTKQIKALIQNANENNIDFPSFEHIRGKTKIPCYAHLTPESMEALELWFKVREKQDSKYVFPNGNGDKDQPIRNETLNDIIKRLVQGAGITPTGQIKFHCVGRKFLMNAGSKIGLNEFQLKFLVAKAISVSDETYLLLKQQIDEKFPQLYEHIRLNGQLQRRLGEQGQLEARVVELESEIAEMKQKYEQATEWRKEILWVVRQLVKEIKETAKWSGEPSPTLDKLETLLKKLAEHSNP